MQIVEFSSVSEEVGIQACKKGLKLRKRPLVPTQNVTEMIQTVLNNSVFAFDNTSYIQTEGIANGSRLGKNFACSYMRKWYKKLDNFEKRPFFSLQKYAYSNILKILPPKYENFQIKNSDILHISAQNIDCGYSLEPPRRF